MIAADPDFGMNLDDLKKTLKPENYVGRAPRQVEVYLRDVVRPVLKANSEALGLEAEINV